MKYFRMRLSIFFMLFTVIIITTLGCLTWISSHKSFERLFEEKLKNFFQQSKVYTQLAIEYKMNEMIDSVSTASFISHELDMLSSIDPLNASKLHRLLNDKASHHVDFMMVFPFHEGKKKMPIVYNPSMYELDNVSKTFMAMPVIQISKQFMHSVQSGNTALLFLLSAKPLVDTRSGEIKGVLLGGIELSQNSEMKHAILRNTRLDKLNFCYEKHCYGYVDDRSITSPDTPISIDEISKHYGYYSRLSLEGDASPLSLFMQVNHFDAVSINTLFHYEMTWGFALIFSSLLSILILVRWSLIHPLEKLKNFTQERSKTPFSTLAKPQFFIDEYTILLNHFDELLEHMHSNQQELVASKEKIEQDMMIIDRYVILFTYDLQGVITLVSEAFCTISGYTKEELMGEHFKKVLDASLSNDTCEAICRVLLEYETWFGELANTSKEGKPYWISVQITPLCENGSTVGHMAICKDISDKKSLETLSTTDALTGLYNRRKLDEILQNEYLHVTRHTKLFSIIMIDIDHFKVINDLHGHLVGDRALKTFVMLLCQHIRKTDSIGRWGGEEFLIIAPQTTYQETLKMAEKIRQSVENHLFEEIGPQSISLGVASYTQGDTIEDLISYADEALYRAKKEGRNRVC